MEKFFKNYRISLVLYCFFFVIFFWVVFFAPLIYNFTNFFLLDFLQGYLPKFSFSWPANLKFTFQNSPYYNLSGLLISVLTTYLYFVISTYYIPLRNNIALFKLFVFFIIVNDVFVSIDNFPDRKFIIFFTYILFC